MRVAVPSRVRKKTALRVQRSVAVGYVGVGWGGGELGRWDRVQLATGRIHRLVLQALAHHQPSYPSRLLLVLSLGRLL